MCDRIFLFIAFISAIISLSQPEEVAVNSKSVLHLKLDYDIPDRTSNDPFEIYMNYETFKIPAGLNDILKNIEKAKNDDRIYGIYLDLSNMPSGLATVNEIRDAILDFKSTGKFVYAYGNVYLQKAYYLASVADKVFLNPEGFIEFRGLRGEIAFLKGTLEKLDIDIQIIRHGKYKAAVEPFLRDDMSEENKEQTLTYISSLWNNSIGDIAASRNTSAENLNRIADDLSTQNPLNAYQLNIVDSLIYMDEFLGILANELDIDHVKNENLVSIHDYTRVKDVNFPKTRSKNKIAVVYASGDIMQGEGDENTIGGDKISRTIRRARLDDDIKAVVLRVNSPGGDGLASDIILREVKLCSAVKPVVVSMGNLAASGGYYISCGADYIISDPTTITGSIGVFGLIPNFQGLFNNKLGITFDGVNTNKNADFISVNKPLTDYQRQVLTNLIERFYDSFVTHVAEGRDMEWNAVDEIAQGRVWSGADALELGLVDELGGLTTAIETAKDLAGLEDYRTVDLPERKEPFEQIFEDLFGQTRIFLMKNELGENYRYLRYFEMLKQQSGVQARLPYEIVVQ